jgi:glyoxylase-like metal-dependent hydrolase (beta-lactamase superfamily II)
MMKLKTILVALITLLMSAGLWAAPPPEGPANGETVEVIHVRGNVYMLVTPVANMAFSVGEDGIVTVDSATDVYTEDIFAAIRELSPNGVLRFIINTSSHYEHTNGNYSLSAKGGSTGDKTYDDTKDVIQGALIIAHEEVLFALSLDPAIPAESWPTDGFFEPEAELFFNGEPIKVYYVADANGQGSSFVHFRSADVIVTGDMYNTTTYPEINLEEGGSINGIINGLVMILNETVPAAIQEGGTLVIPGHGRLSDEADVVEYRDMLIIIRDRVQKMIDEGMSLQQVLAAAPSSDYDARYSAESGPSSTAEFVERVYLSLVAQ